jgi:putative O-acetyl transferase related protein
MKERINWIDWGKVIAIYLVVLGHHLNRGTATDEILKNYIYAFHMPFFFFLSGYLFDSKEQDLKKIIIKGLKTLVLPYVFLNITVCIVLIPSFILSKHIPIDNLFYFLTADAAGTGGPSWFLICLFEVWIIASLILKLNTKIQILTLLICVLIAYTFPYHLWWRIDTCFAAIPFFIIGYYMRDKKLMPKFSSLGNLFFTILLGVITYWASLQTGYVNIYLREFGLYPYIYYILGFLGIMHLYFFCCLFKNYTSRILVTFSTGTIIIMGWHGISDFYLYSILKYFFPFLLGDSLLWSICFCVGSMFTLYFPIRFLQKRHPTLIGGRKSYARKPE